MKRLAGGFGVAVALAGFGLKLRAVFDYVFINCGILNCWPF